MGVGRKVGRKGEGRWGGRGRGGGEEGWEGRGRGGGKEGGGAVGRKGEGWWGGRGKGEGWYGGRGRVVWRKGKGGMKEGEGRGKGRKQEVTLAEEIKGLCIAGQVQNFSDGNPATLGTSQYWDSLFFRDDPGTLHKPRLHYTTYLDQDPDPDPLHV